jgi:hypothetical protein
MENSNSQQTMTHKRKREESRDHICYACDHSLDQLGGNEYIKKCINKKCVRHHLRQCCCPYPECNKAYLRFESAVYHIRKCHKDLQIEGNKVDAREYINWHSSEKHNRSSNKKCKIDGKSSKDNKKSKNIDLNNSKESINECKKTDLSTEVFRQLFREIDLNIVEEDDNKIGSCNYPIIDPCGRSWIHEFQIPFNCKIRKLNIDENEVRYILVDNTSYHILQSDLSSIYLFN